MLVGYTCLLNKNLQVIHLGRKIVQIDTYYKKGNYILVCLKQKTMSTLSITEGLMRVHSKIKCILIRDQCLTGNSKWYKLQV